MRITILTLFPNLFDPFLKESIIKRIVQKKVANIEIINFRKFATNATKRVDDYQYGGGGGMVIALPAIVKAIKNYRTKKSRVILLTPQGNTHTQQKARELTKYEHLILVAGHYEGFDERILHYVDETLSIGDYVLTGGEIPAMVIVETIVRLLDNAINKKSLHSETFDNNLLDYPVYTKPKVFEQYAIPQVLLSGNHQLIKEYRLKQQILKTKKYRLDLYHKYLKENKYDKNK